MNDMMAPLGVSCDGANYALTFPYWRFAPTGEFQLGASQDVFAPGNPIPGAFVEGGIWRMCGDSVFVEYTVDTVTIPTTDGSLSQYFNVGGIPAAAVVKDGKVVWRGHPARLSEQMLKDWIAS